MQPMNTAKKGLVAIEVDFLASALECMVHTKYTSLEISACPTWTVQL